MSTLTAKGTTGTLEFDGSFVTIKRSGMARMTVGKGEKRIPVRSINSVQLKPAGAMVNGFIAFSIAGGVERQSRFGSQTTDAAKDENAVVFTKKHQGDFEAIRSAVEASIAAGSVSVAAAAAPSEGMDLVAQIAKLAELRDAGVLSVEEFDAKKAELLARM